MFYVYCILLLSFYCLLYIILGNFWLKTNLYYNIVILCNLSHIFATNCIWSHAHNSPLKMTVTSVVSAWRKKIIVKPILLSYKINNNFIVIYNWNQLIEFLKVFSIRVSERWAVIHWSNDQFWMTRLLQGA